MRKVLPVTWPGTIKSGAVAEEIVIGARAALTPNDAVTMAAVCEDIVFAIT